RDRQAVGPQLGQTAAEGGGDGARHKAPRGWRRLHPVSQVGNATVCHSPTALHRPNFLPRLFGLTLRRVTTEAVPYTPGTTVPAPAPSPTRYPSPSHTAVIVTVSPSSRKVRCPPPGRGRGLAPRQDSSSRLP